MDMLPDATEPGEGAHFVPLTRVGDITAAGVLAALLRSEGIEVRVHSQAFGPYPVTVGQMAETELWVMSDRVADASAILLDAEVNEAMAAADPDGQASRAVTPLEFRFLALAMGLVLFVLFALRFARVY